MTWLHRAGLAPGDRLATFLPNGQDAFALGLACMLEGIVQVPLPEDLVGTERHAILADCDPAATLDAAPDGGFAALPPSDPHATTPRTRPMAYTSGTSGRRKGVHVGVHDADWGAELVEDEHAAFDRRHGDRHLVVSPLYHSGPFRFAVVTALTGGRVLVMDRFDVGTWQHLLRTYRPTSLFCVPTQLHRLLAHPETDADLFASVTLLAHAGAPCPIPLKERLLELAPDGATWEFYGSTEGQFTVCPPSTWQRLPGTVGVARQRSRIDVRDPRHDGIGTVWAHVPHHARWEYWRDPDRTAAAWDGDAFTVGDLGRLTRVDGHHLLTLHGRPGDLVITGGVNVYPAEVERVLLDHPAVGEVAVFGVPDDEWGQRVVAAVIARPGHAVGTDDLLGFARRRLRRAQVPREVHLVDDLPRTPTGKISRVGLRDWLEGSS